MNIKRKVEAAFAAYLKTVAGLAASEEEDALPALTIVAAHEFATQDFPLCLVHCQNCQPESDLGPDALEYSAELLVQLITSTDDNDSQPEEEGHTQSAPLADPRLAILQAAMRDQTAIRAALNIDPEIEDTDDDNRSVTGFHVKNVFEKDQDATTQDRNFIDSLEYTAHVCDFNADP